MDSSEAPMEEQAKTFLGRMISMATLILLLLAAFNVLVDPYVVFDSPRWKHVNESKPSALDADRFMKLYGVFRAHPRTLILGTSTVDMGLDVLSDAWPMARKPIYNLGILGVDVRGSYEYLQHALRFSHPDLVVIGVEFDQFLGRWASPLSERERSRLEKWSDRGQRDQVLEAMLSFDAFADSVTTLADNSFGPNYPLEGGNFPIEGLELTYRRLGAASVFESAVMDAIAGPAEKPRSVSTIEDLKAIVELCRSKGVGIKIVISPVHASILEIYDVQGYWRPFEEWKRNLVSLTPPDGVSSRDVGVEVWDFSDYDVYSTSAPAQATMWFLNPTHYRRNLGDSIIRRLFGINKSQLGSVLTRGSIAEHLAAIREHQLSYRKIHPEAVDALRQQYRDVAIDLLR